MYLFLSTSLLNDPYDDSKLHYMHKKLENIYDICFYAVTSYTDDIFCNNGNVRVCVMRGTSAHTVDFSAKHSGVHTVETGMFC